MNRVDNTWGPDTPQKSVLNWHTGFALTLVVLVILMARVMGLGPPMLFADEYVYAAAAFHMVDPAYISFFPANINNHLYSLISSVIFVGQGDIVVKARVLNVVLAILMIAPLSSIVRHAVPDKWHALLVASAVTMALSGYMAYLMPETLYFALFIYLVAALLLYFRQPTLSHLIVASVVHGLLICAKPHGAFLLPAAAVSLSVLHASFRKFRISGSDMARAVVYCAIAYLAFVLVSSIVSGSLVVNPFAGGYSQHLEKSLSTDKTLSFQFFHDSIRIAVWNAGVIMLIGSFSLAVLLASIFRWVLNQGRTPHSAVDVSVDVLALFLLLSLLTLFAVTAVFSASVAGSGIYESARRIHGRYFEVALIAVLVVGAARASSVLQGMTPTGRGVLLASSLIISLIAANTLSRGIWQYGNDFASGYAAANFPIVRIYVLYGAVALAILGALRPAWASRYMIAVFVMYFAFNVYKVDAERIAFGGSLLDRYGESMQTSAAAASVPTATLFLAHDADAFRAAFYMIGRGQMLQAQSASGFSCEQLAAYDSLITLQDIGAPCGYPVVDQEGKVQVIDAPNAR